MNADQRTNIDAMVGAIAETLFSAWSYFHLLQGFHQGSKAHPIVVRQFDRLFDQVWRAVFDGLFVKAGTLIDRSRGTYSLPNLLTVARGYAAPELKPILKDVGARLKAPNGPLAKIESWRHEAVAHRTPAGLEGLFYINNKMHLDDIATGLRQLEELLNTISLEVLNVYHDTETGSEDIVRQGAALFACVAELHVPRADSSQTESR